MDTKNDPLREAVAYAKSVSARDDRIDCLEAYIKRLQEAVESIARLRQAWIMEGSVFSMEPAVVRVNVTSPTLAFSGSATADAGQPIPEWFMRYVANRAVSVRDAVLASIFTFGPLTSRGVVSRLEEAGHPAKNLGNQVRSALWQARRKGTLRPNPKGVQDFASSAEREKFARESGLPM